jgi:hypothetical protein
VSRKGLKAEKMKRDDWEFMKRKTLDIEARHMACRILGVEDTASKEELKKAYRRTARKFHPDKNMDVPEANKKFILVKCAYELLANDRPCPALLEKINSWPGVPENDKYRLDNPWGHFLWWREKFFDSEVNSKLDKPTFCV